MSDSWDFSVGDKVSVIGDLKMGTISHITKESGIITKVKVNYGDGISEWHVTEGIQKLLLEMPE